MFNTLRQRMGFLFLAFSFLVTISVVATSWTITAQKQDALIVNLAGRQRMLVQQMTKNVLQLEKGGDSARSAAQILPEAARTFEQTLAALADGGEVSYLPGQTARISATYDPTIRAGLEQVDRTWHVFRGHLDTVMTVDPAGVDFVAAVRSVERLAPELVRQADLVVRLYEAATAQKVARSWLFQFAFFGGALALLVAGFIVTQKSLADPLRALGAIAERIGRGDLDTDVEVAGPQEVKALAQNLEAMRAQLKTSRGELLALNEDLENRVVQRTHELTTAFELSQEIVTELELDHLLSSVTDRARVLTQAQAAVLCLLAPNGEYLDLAASSGKAVIHAGLRQSVGHDLAAQVIRAGQTVVDEVACFNCRFLKAHTLDQCVATPLRAGEQTLGALCVVRSGRRGFDLDETRALTLLANSAAIAIANARLVETGRCQAEQAAVLTERERLAAELHDNLAQTLGFFNMKIGRVKALIARDEQAQARYELDRISAVVADTYGQVREAIIGLRREATNGNLAHYLSEQAATFQQENGLPVHFSQPDEDAADIVLPPAAMGEVARIVSEAIANAGRHASACRIEVALQRDVSNETAIIIVRDNGRGFDSRCVPTEEQGHFGLSLMRTRAKHGGGKLQIESMPGQGTRVILQWPLN